MPVISGTDGNDTLLSNEARDTLEGGLGNDLLEVAGHDGVYIVGGGGDDQFVVDWSGTPTYSLFYSYIREASDTTVGGDDTLDLSALVSDISQVHFSGSQGFLGIHIYGGNDQQIGTVRIYGDAYYDEGAPVETLVIGNQSYDLTLFDSGAELTSWHVYGATYGNDTVTGNRSREAVYGFSGNDTLAAGGEDSYLVGGDGNDRLHTNGYQRIGLYGNAGTNTYVIDASDQNRYYHSIYSTSLTEDYASDILDLSAVAESAGSLSFTSVYTVYYGWYSITSTTSNLYVNIHDDEGDVIGVITINGQYDIESNTKVAYIRLGDGTYISTLQGNSGDELHSIIQYGAASGADVITSDNISDYVYGFGGNDTLTTGAEDVRLYGGDGHDRLVAQHDDSWLYGGDGSDTYVIDWLDVAEYSNYSTSIRMGSNELDTGTNRLDLTAVADSLNNISFSTYGSSSVKNLRIEILNVQGISIGNVDILGFIENGSIVANDGGAALVATIIVGNATFDISPGDTLDGLNEALNALLAETLEGSDAGDKLEGFGGTDYINGGQGADNISGGRGSDTLIGGTDNDTLKGDQDADIVFAGAGDDRVWAGYGDGGNDTLVGGSGNDILAGGGGQDLLIGGGADEGSQQLAGITESALLDGSDTLFGGWGNDTILGGGWDDGAVNDNGVFDDGEQVISGSEADEIWAGDGSDLIYAASGADLIGGGGGGDTIYAGGGNDTIYGGNNYGSDSIDSGAGDDLVFAGQGYDSLNGGAGDDNLFSGADSDTVDAGAGDDTLWGGGGNDQFTGGDGRDTFVFEVGHGRDTVTDFNVYEDILVLSGTETNFTSSSAVAAAATVQDNDVLIDLGAGDSVLLEGVSLSELGNITYVFT